MKWLVNRQGQGKVAESDPELDSSDIRSGHQDWSVPKALVNENPDAIVLQGGSIEITNNDVTESFW